MRFILTLLTLWQTVLGFASESFQYKISGESTSRVWLSALQRVAGEPSNPTDKPDMDLRQQYHYTLTITPLSSTQYEAQWREWRVETELTPELKQLLQEIAQLSPVYFQRDATGALQFYSPTGHEAWQRQAVASILYPFQFVRPNPNRTEWRTEESHPNGRIVCRYRLVRQQKDGVQVYNKAVAEVLLSEEERQMGKTHQIRGHLQYTLDSRGVILAVSGALRERVQFQGLPASENETKIDIRLERRTRITPESLQAKRTRLAQLKGAWFSLYAPPTEAEQERARALSHLQGTSQAQVLAELDRMLARIDKAEPVPMEEQTALRLKLDAGLIIYGAPFLQELTQRLRQRTRDDDGFWLLIGVLSQSELPEAQDALLQTFTQATDESIRRGLAQQFSFLRAPRPAIVEALWKQARDMPPSELQQILTVSVSNLARRIREQASETYQSISAWARAQLEAAQDSPNQRFWLTVVGNLGDPAAFPLIEQHARRGDELTRLNAMDALSQQPAQDALALLERLYSIEPSVAVREKMVQLIPAWWREPTARRLLEQAAFNDPSPRVRKACIQALGSIAASDKDALQLLVKIAESNSDPSIRREAMITLAALRASGVQVPNVKAAP